MGKRDHWQCESHDCGADFKTMDHIITNVPCDLSREELDRLLKVREAGLNCVQCVRFGSM